MPATHKPDDDIGRTVFAVFACCTAVVAFFAWGIIGPIASHVGGIVSIAWSVGRLGVFVAAIIAVFWLVRDRIDAYVEHHHTKLDVERLVRHRAPAPVAGELPRAQDVRDSGDQQAA